MPTTWLHCYIQLTLCNLFLLKTTNILPTKSITQNVLPVDTPDIFQTQQTDGSKMHANEDAHGY